MTGSPVALGDGRAWCKTASPAAGLEAVAVVNHSSGPGQERGRRRDERL